jgi:outer membrane protein TolC
VTTFPRADSEGRRRPRHLLGLAALLAAHTAGAAGSAPIQFAEELFPGLARLIEQSALQASELELRELRVEERLGDLDVARSQRRLNLRLHSRILGSYETRSDIENEFRGDVNASLTLTQPLYQWGNLERQERIAAHRATLESHELERAGARHFMYLRRDYLEWRLMRERRDILRQSIALSTEFVEAQRRLADAGQSSEHDVLEMQARLLEQQESLAWVERMITDLGNRIARRSGGPLGDEAGEGPGLEAIEPITFDQLETLERTLRTGSPDYWDSEYRSYGLLETIEAEQLAMLDKRHWPTFDLVAGAYSDQLDAVNSDDSVTRVRYFAGLQVNWNLFDSWQTDGYKRSTLARKRAAALRREEAADETVRRAEMLLSELRLNLRQIEARGQREQLLDRRLRLLREQAERDLIPGTERLEGEIDYLDVRQRLMESRVNYLVNLMELGLLLKLDPAAKLYSPES